MNRRMSEANMYLYNSYGYNAPSQLTYAILVKDGSEGTATELIAYDSDAGYQLASLPAAGTKNFVGWYVFDGKADGNIEGSPITKLDKNTAGKKIVAKFSETVIPFCRVPSSLLPTVAPSRMFRGSARMVAVATGLLVGVVGSV